MIKLKPTIFFIAIVLHLSSCKKDEFVKMAVFQVNDTDLTLHNKDYLGMPQEEHIFTLNASEVNLKITPDMLNLFQNMYWKVGDKFHSVVSEQKRLSISEFDPQIPTQVSLCRSVDGPCVSTFIIVTEEGISREVEDIDIAASTEFQDDNTKTQVSDPILSNQKSDPKIESENKSENLPKQEKLTNKNVGSKLEVVDLNRKSEFQSAENDRQKLAKEAEEKKVSDELAAKVKADEEKQKLNVFAPTSIGLVNKLSSTAALNDESDVVDKGAMTIKPTRNMILFEAKLKVEGHGKVEFSLSGDGIRNEISLIKNVNDGLNTIRFTDLKHAVLQAGKTYILQYECLGDVKAIVIKNSFFNGSSNSDLSLTGKQILYDLSYKF